MLDRFRGRGWRTRLLRLVGRRPPTDPPGSPSLSDEDFVDLAYRFLLRRAADPVGRPDKLAKLRAGVPRDALLDEFVESPEFLGRPMQSGTAALHVSRSEWVRALPPADRIIDLGGVSLASERGALLDLGYPYPFSELTIVDLPPEDRHDLYVSDTVDVPVTTPQGPVRYRYHSMIDLSGVPDGSMDLVMSGQTFEHVPPADGKQLLAEAFRVLRPGGHLALDTPNRALTSLQLGDPGMDRFIDPDHDVEYTHGEMVSLLEAAGFVIERAQGLNWMPDSVRQGEFDHGELTRRRGLHADIESCYLLAYLALKP